LNDRRFWFFLAAATACALLVTPTPGEFRWVPKMLVVIYVVLAALVALERLSRPRNGDPPP
jgi:ABC-type transport system involved in cytochrome c biogenesis permease component